MNKDLNKRYEEVRTVPITGRVRQLRQAVLDAKPILCSERALIVTKCYQETEGMHFIERRARALYRILDEMTLRIWDGELLVGTLGTNGRRSAPVFPEFSIEWMKDELDNLLETREQDTFEVPEQVKEDIRSIFPYWENKSIYQKYRKLLPEDTKKVRDAYVFSRDLFERNGYGHTAYQAEKIIKIGLKGLRAEVKAKYADLDLTKREDFDKKLFYDGLLICFDAITNYAKRYSDKALSMAKIESDPKRKAELFKIADVCSWVPENPARDIWEALQVVEFMQIVLQLETSGDSVSPGRMDQYLYPFYQKAMEDGIYTISQIQELFDCIWLKFNEIVKVQDTESVHIHPGFPMTQNVTAGGVTREGRDATNELSYIMLTCQEHIRLQQPQFTVRYHDDTPEDFKLRAADVIAYGTGMPALFGDRGCIASMKRFFPDMPVENMRNYSIVGCIELAPEGFQARVNGGFLNLARVVDLAMNDGVDRLTGKQLGPKTGDPAKFQTFDDLFTATERQMKFIIHHQVVNNLVVDYVQRENTPHLFLSSLVDGCIEKGRDLTWGGSRWGSTPILLGGIATASNALAAVKEKVFDKGQFCMEAVNDALNTNFEGDEAEKIQEELLAAPKYGNDDDFADAMMKKMTDAFFAIIESHKDIDDRNYSSFTVTLGGTVPMGWKTGATADGRKATMPISDSFSPANEGENGAPTQVLLSAGKIDQSHFSQGNVLNLKFTKTAFQSAEAKKKLMDMVTVYFNTMEGQEIQFNVVDGRTLRQAQKTPEKYQDLIIRVAGYSARFVELAQELQNDIIARTEHDRI
ncbi:MAG: glycyl radical protein [Emergencia timonensis]|uniref:glycyl radical protein n=1 Tax=Emergencia timonensis TaxID=1776384 RepID=UPI0008330A96|nr:pyruvate formate lyase family protein [Emergencia timonensis]WNX88178.1 pyruvate formate lyase family protein [Emergencia timonensis]